MSKRLVYLTVFITLFIIGTGCHKDKVPGNNPGANVDLNGARLNDLVVEELAYADIQITHPVITNGVEVTEGVINLKLPAGTTNLQLTPKTANFTLTDFTISPALGTKLNFSAPVLYSIISKADASKRVHYRVNVSVQPPPPNEPLKINKFTFKKADNPQLPQDIEASQIIDAIATMGKIFIFVPEGTDYTILKAAVTTNATSMVYTQDPLSVPANSTLAYPAGGLVIDYRYPRSFYLVAKKGQETLIYDVIVDIKKPIRFDNANPPFAFIKTGQSGLVTVTQITNLGNHPITFSAVNTTNQQPIPVPSLIRTIAAVPSGGLLPNGKTDVKVNLEAVNFPAGVYTATGSITPRIFNNNETDAFLETSSLTISAQVTN
jgi:hypothetical protein